ASRAELIDILTDAPDVATAEFGEFMGALASVSTLANKTFETLELKAIAVAQIIKNSSDQTVASITGWKS
ncbi:MAG: hypothetical protein QM530_08525, partial [Phycisphaerales bacterium]|nr:hypothetical protein [Phycisphaerales bacterium]